MATDQWEVDVPPPHLLGNLWISTVQNIEKWITKFMMPKSAKIMFDMKNAMNVTFFINAYHCRLLCVLSPRNGNKDLYEDQDMSLMWYRLLSFSCFWEIVLCYYNFLNLQWENIFLVYLRDSANTLCYKISVHWKIFWTNQKSCICKIRA